MDNIFSFLNNQEMNYILWKSDSWNIFVQS